MNYSINIDDIAGIKRAYNKAVKEKKDDFLYKGRPFLVAYAKYLLEYYETIIKNSKKY